MTNLQNPTEIWKDIPTLEGKYQASTYGRVRTLPRSKKGRWGNYYITKMKVMNPSKDAYGYFQITITPNHGITRKLHRLIAITFIDNPSNLPEVNHINGIKTDNRVENLEWVTTGENIRHGFKTGLIKAARGEKNGLSKLNSETVVEIRQLYKSGGYTFRSLGKLYGVSNKTIESVLKRETWKHVA